MYDNIDLDSDVGSAVAPQKKWLSSADKSMSKLGKVKTNIYTMTPTDPRSLKATKSHLLSTTDVTVVTEEDESRVAGIESQRSAWGNQKYTADHRAPDTHSHRHTVRARPESAKHPTVQTLQSEKRRPYSAKTYARSDYQPRTEQDVEISEDFEEGGESVLGVAGARYTQGHRPDHVSYLSGHVGYVAPVTKTTTVEKEIKETVKTVLQTGGETAVPTAPRSSRVLSHPLDTNQDYEEREPLIAFQALKMSLTLPNADEQEDYDPDVLPQEPRVHVTQIQKHALIRNEAAQNYQPIRNEAAQNEQPIRLQSSINEHLMKMEPFQSEAPISTDVNKDFNKENETIVPEKEDKTNHSYVTEFDLRAQINELQHEIEDFEAQIVEEDSIPPSQILNGEESRRKPTRPSSAKNSSGKVMTSDHKVMTSDLGSRSQRYRPGSGRRDLRYVKSRTDSGVKQPGPRPPDMPRPNRQRPVSAGTYTVESAKATRVAQSLRERPGSATVATLNVEYLDYSSGDEDRGGSHGGSHGNGAGDNRTNSHNMQTISGLTAKPPLCKQKRSNGSKSTQEPVTFVSRMENTAVSDNRVDNDVSINGTSVTSKSETAHQDNETQVQADSHVRFLSATEKNYYEIAMAGGAQKKQEKAAKEKEDAAMQLRKAVKTLELTDDKEVKENTAVTLIHAPEVDHIEYVAPRPRSPKRSAQKPEEQPVVEEKLPKPEPPNATKATHDANGRRINRPASAKQQHQQPATQQATQQHSQAVKVTASEVWLENGRDEDLERPGSRLGFHVTQVSRNQDQINCHMTSLASQTASSTINRDSPKKSSLKSRPHSAHQFGCKHTMSGQKSVSYLLSDERTLKGNPNLNKTVSRLDKKYGKDKQPSGGEIIEIWTRREEFEFETEGVKECRGIQERLLENGVPVTLKTLTRALLPPTEYGWKGPSYKTSSTPSRRPFSSGLLTKPETWLPEEHKRLKDTERKVREVTLALLEQKKQEEKRAAGSAGSGEGKRKKKKAAGKKAGNTKSSKVA